MFVKQPNKDLSEEQFMFSLLDLLPLALALIVCYKIKFAKPFKSNIREDFLSVESGKSIRGLLAIIIVLHHLTDQIAVADSGIIFRSFNYIGFLAVSVFFFISGYGLQKQYINNENYKKGFLKKRLPGVLFPYIIINLVVWALSFTADAPYSAKDVLMGFVNGNPMVTHSWYIISILIFYIVFWALMMLCKKRYTLMLLGGAIYYVLYALFCIKMGYGAWWYNTAHLLVIGMFWALFEEKILNVLKKRFWTVSLSAFAIFAVLFLIIRKIPDNGLPKNSIFAAGFFVLFLLLFLMKVKIGNPILKYLGGISLELYLCHSIFLSLFRSAHIYIENNILYALAAIGASVIFAHLFNRLDKWILQGYKKLVLR